MVMWRRVAALLLLFTLASPLLAFELSEKELALLFAPFEELQEEPQIHYVAQAMSHTLLYGDDREENAAANDRSVRLLLRKMKRNPYYSGFTPEGRRIARRGAEAMPTLLEELEGAREYYRNCLLDIMSMIDDPRRDAAFVAQLESLLTEKEKFLTDNTVERLMRTAGSQGIQEAVPVLNKFLTAEGFRVETRAEARVALVQLGALEISTLPDVPYEVEAGLDLDSVRSEVALLDMLLKYDSVRAPLRLVETDAGGGETNLLKGTIDGGTWNLRVGQEQSGRVPFYYTWNTGPLSAAGYMGVAEQTSGQWIVVYWRMMWIS